MADENNITTLAKRLRPFMKLAAQEMVPVTAYDHGALSGLSDDDHTQYVLETTSITAGAGLTGGGQLSADRTLTVGAGLGITVNADDVALTTPGTLTVSSTNSSTGSHTHAVTSSSNPGAAASLLATTAAGKLTLQKLAIGDDIGSDLIPESTDTYDIGSSLNLWRKGYLSEIDAVIFAEQTISLLGGWLIVGHDEGAIAATVDDSNTTVDFGETMTVGDFVEFRAALKVEYMQVGSLVSGTTYNVTRNLDGSGANNWTAGTPFLVLGTTGDGRIELNSYDTPRISIVTQGATYNAQTEVARLGDLDTNWGYSATTYGLALGEYASGKANVTIDPTNGFRIRSYATTILQIKNSDGLGYIVGPLQLDTGGGIYQGSGTFASPTTGLKMWNDGGYGRIGGYNGSALQWFVDTDGKLYAGGSGKGVALSAAGLRLNVTSEVPPATDIQWLESATARLQLGVDLAFDDAYMVTTENFRITASAGTITLDAAAYIATGAADDLRVGGGLYVGDVGTDPVAGRVYTGYTQTLTVDVAEGYCAAYMAYPTYSGGYTVTRHSYIYLNQPTLASGAAVTDACVFRFSSAAGTHKAVDSGSTKSSPGTVSAWVKVDVAGTIYYIPAYTSKTS